MNAVALRNASKHTWAVGVAAPALVIAGVMHPGTYKAKVLLGLTGVLLGVAYWGDLKREASKILG